MLHSQSARITECPCSLSQVARCTDSVDLPTPPLEFATTMIMPEHIQPFWACCKYYARRAERIRQENPVIGIAVVVDAGRKVSWTRGRTTCGPEELQDGRLFGFLVINITCKTVSNTESKQVNRAAC